MDEQKYIDEQTDEMHKEIENRTRQLLDDNMKSPTAFAYLIALQCGIIGALVAQEFEHKHIEPSSDVDAYLKKLWLEG